MADVTVQYESVCSAVSGLATWSGPVLGGTLVMVWGVGLAAATRTVRCRFRWGELVAASTHLAGEVQCVAPPHGATGWVGVELVSLDETVGGGSFLYEARATVSLVLPLLGPVESGSRLTVLGSHFRESSALTPDRSDRANMGPCEHASWRYIGVGVCITYNKQSEMGYILFFS